MLNLIVIGLQIAELQGVGGFRHPGLTDFKKPGFIIGVNVDTGKGYGRL